MYLRHTASGEPVVCTEVETLVLALGHEANTTLTEELQDFAGEIRYVGDCLAPRTAEEAVLEGLKVSTEL